MRSAEEGLISKLVKRCPHLAAVLEQHLAVYDEILRHVFIADVTRWLVERYVRDPNDDDVFCVVRALDVAFEADVSDDRELIGASFLENLPRGGALGAGLRDRLGPALRGELDRSD